MQKQALSGYDDKRYLIPEDPLYRTLAWGHKDLPESVKEKRPVKIVNTPLSFV